jgi:hypothetical protein
MIARGHCKRGILCFVLQLIKAELEKEQLEAEIRTEVAAEMQVRGPWGGGGAGAVCLKCCGCKDGKLRWQQRCRWG